MSASFSVQYIFHLIDRFTPGATAMAGAATKLQGALAAAGAAMAPLIARMAALGAATAAIGVAFVLGGVRKAAAFEEALTSLRRVTNISRQEMLAYGKDALRVGVETGQTGVAIANIMTEGALMGVRGQKTMEEFARTVAKVAVVWDNISHQEAAKGLASIQAKWLADLPPDEAVKRLNEIANSMNELSNRSPFKAPELLKFMGAASAAGRRFGLTPEQLAAFGGTSMVVDQASGAQQATRAIMTFTKLQQAAAAPMDKQIKAIKALGYKGGEFAQRMRDNPQMFMLDFLTRLSKLDKMKQAAVVTDLMTIKSMRQMTALANNINEYKRQLLIADKTTAQFLKNDKPFMEWLENGSEGMKELAQQIKGYGDIVTRNGSVDREFANRTQSLNFALSQLSSAWERFRINMSMPLLEPLRQATNGLTAFINELGNITEKTPAMGALIMPGLIAWITSAGAAAAAATAKIFGFNTAFATLMSFASGAAALALLITITFIGLNYWEEIKTMLSEPQQLSIKFPDAPEWLKFWMNRVGETNQSTMNALEASPTRKTIGDTIDKFTPGTEAHYSFNKWLEGTWFGQMMMGIGLAQPTPPPSAERVPGAAAERLQIESQVKGQIDPLQVQIQTPGSVQLTLPNGMVAGSVPVGATSNAPRGVSTQEAGSSVVAP